MTSKYLLPILILAIHSLCIAQKTVTPSDSLLIFGNIAQGKTLYLSDLEVLADEPIADVILTNHMGEIKDTLTGLRGIPLKNLLESMKYLHEKPKELNEFYFVLEATDGYQVVISWNELYNNPVGNHFYILTGMKGRKLADMDQRISFISASDIISGRRYIKGLASIEVRRLD